MRWALEDAADGSWWQSAQTPENLDLLARNDVEFKRHLDRCKYPERHGLALADREVERDTATQALLVPLDARLQSQPYLGGGTPCATDLAIFPFVRQFAAVDARWFEAQNLPALQAWLAAWLSSALFAACMVKLTAHTEL